LLAVRPATVPAAVVPVIIGSAAAAAEGRFRSLPFVAAVTAILVVNNLRDIDTDHAAGKRTLAVRFGRRATRVQYVLLVVGVYLAPLVGWLAGGASAWFWLPRLTLPLAVPIIRAVVGLEGRPLNAAQKGTARLHLVFGLVLWANRLL
jgi:1,4-dihydroxy-2-naphthoate polyprenyltransferase